MSTIVTLPNGQILVSIPEGGVDTTATSIALPGDNAADFATLFANGLVRLLVNSAGPIAPNYPNEGQLWFNTGNLPYPSLFVYYQGTWLAIDTAAYKKAQSASDLANSISDQVSTLVNITNNDNVAFINGVFANAQAQAQSIIDGAAANFGSAEGFVNSVLAQANAAATLANQAAANAAAQINSAVANALSTANGAVIATYVAQANSYVNQAAGYALIAQAAALVASSNAGVAYAAAGQAAQSASNATSAASSAATYSINAAGAALNANAAANAASISQSAAGASATNAAQSAFSTHLLVDQANTAASQANVAYQQAAAASQTANSASAAAFSGASLAANAASNASSYAGQAQAYSNIAVAASNTANTAQSAAFSILGLATNAASNASASATNAAVYATQALHSFANANVAASTASTSSNLATNAATTASNAANSSISYASIANSYASNASQSAIAAQASALQANTSASSAQYYQSVVLNASNSATGAASSAQASAVLAASVKSSSYTVLNVNSDFNVWANTYAGNTASYSTVYTGNYFDPNSAVNAVTISQYPAGIVPLNIHYLNNFSQETIANALQISTGRNTFFYPSPNSYPPYANANIISNTVTWGFTTTSTYVPSGWFVVEADVAFNQCDLPYRSNGFTAGRPEKYAGVIVKSFASNGSAIYNTLDFYNDPDTSGLTANAYALYSPKPPSGGVWNGNYIKPYTLPSGVQIYSYTTGPVANAGYNAYWYYITSGPASGQYIIAADYETPRKFRKLIYIPAGGQDNSQSLKVYACSYSPFFTGATTNPDTVANSASLPSDVPFSGKSMLWTHLALRPATDAEIQGHNANAAVPVIQSQIINLANVVASNNATTATAIAGLVSQFNNANASLLTIQNTVATNNAATVSQLNTLQAGLTLVNSNAVTANGIIQSEITSLNGSITSLGNVVVTQNSVLTSQYNALNSSFTTYTLNTNNAITSTNANVASLSTAFSNANSATAQQISALKASLTVFNQTWNLNPTFATWNSNGTVNYFDWYPASIVSLPTNTPYSWNRWTNTATISGAYTYINDQPQNYVFHNIHYVQENETYYGSFSSNGTTWLVTDLNPPNLGNTSSISLTSNSLGQIQDSYFNYASPFGAGLNDTNTLTPGWYTISATIAFDSSSDSRYGSGVRLIDKASNATLCSINFAWAVNTSNTYLNPANVQHIPSGANPTLYHPEYFISNTATYAIFARTANASAGGGYYEDLYTYNQVFYVANTVAQAQLQGVLFSQDLWYRNAQGNSVSSPSWGNAPAKPSRAILWQSLALTPFTPGEASVAANITTLSNVVATANTATATQLTTLTASINNTNATVTTQGTAIANLNGYASAAYTLNLNANGVVTGYKAFAGSNGVSNFDILASNFTVSDPNNSANKFTPLSYANGTLTIGNCVIDGSLVVAGTITTNRLQDRSVSTTLAYLGSSTPVPGIGSFQTVYSAPVVLIAQAAVSVNAHINVADRGLSGYSANYHYSNTVINVSGTQTDGTTVNSQLTSAQGSGATGTSIADIPYTMYGFTNLQPGTYTITMSSNTSNDDVYTGAQLVIQWLYK